MTGDELQIIEKQMLAWNSGNIAEFLAGLSDDVAYCSPLVPRNHEGTTAWIQGKDEVTEHLLGLYTKFDKLELVDIQIGSGFLNLLLRHQAGLMSMLIEPDENLQARRIIVCHSRPTPDQNQRAT